MDLIRTAPSDGDILRSPTILKCAAFFQYGFGKREGDKEPHSYDFLIEDELVFFRVPLYITFLLFF